MREHPVVELVETGPLRYIHSVPRRLPTETRALPLLFFLHGYREAAPADIREALTRHGPLRVDSNWRVREEFIVVAPQLPQAGDTWYRYADAVAEVLRDVQASQQADPQRAYLTGFSYGGNGVFDLALSQPELWAALWAVDPTRVPTRDPNKPVWLSIGAAARPQTQRFVETLKLKAGSPMATGQRLYLDEGQDHIGSATLAYRSDHIYDWLLLQHQPAR